MDDKTTALIVMIILIFVIISTLVICVTVGGAWGNAFLMFFGLIVFVVAGVMDPNNKMIQ